MKKPPRDTKERLFNRKTVALSVMQGLIILLIIALVFKFALYSGQTENEARALSFTTLIIANLGLILTNMSWSGTIFSTLKSGNKAMRIILAAAIVFLSEVLCIPFLQKLFKFGALHSSDFALALGAGIFSVICFELLKKAIQQNNN